MVPTVINIEGCATISTVAERATLLVGVFDSGYDKDSVSKNVVNTVNSLQAELDLLCPRLENGDISPEAPVSFFSISSLTTSSREERAEDDQGRLARRTGKDIYTTNTNLDIRFRDFGKLGQMVVQLSSTPLVQVKGVTWKLTEEKRTALQDQVRMDALRRAIQRAQSYAQIIGRSNTVTPVKIQDHPESQPTGRAKQRVRMQMAASPALSLGGGIDFEPQLIEVSAKLDVEFHAE
ncbi:hypothetical protein A1O3_00953 [Capronia epimyces CBS 606.96]|uniref:DUF541 domain-containing protein n=1 Tax=Capronia epimyces CBS 606.96 TaxID=1182542 RepID=W9YHR1_9EURO|nr:uncharacterized protein A1O3_00953 [Capronia epimyces CBS 606.96]EXJ92402.1 hypothetical protein A1O3_00953 [Capronia epimyces CBS 606.96]